MKNKLYIATYSENAVEVCREYGVGLELNDFCISENLDPDKIENTYGFIEQELEQSQAKELIFHGPFTEIIPASIDHRAVELGLERLEEAYQAARHLGINRMVLHSGHFPLLYFKEWHHDKSLYFWKKFMENKPEDLVIYIENVFEDEPEMMKKLIDELDDPRLKICLDVGHANVYTTSEYRVKDWIRILGNRIGHFHLHNNDGSKDQHGPVFEGQLDMKEILKTAEEYCPDATFTVESRVCRESIEWLLKQ